MLFPPLLICIEILGNSPLKNSIRCCLSDVQSQYYEPYLSIPSSTLTSNYPLLFDNSSLTSPCYPLTGHHTLAPSQPEPIITRTSSHTLSPNRPEPILTRSASYREPSLSNLKRASAEVEVITSSSPLGNNDNMMTFSSSTLPR